ncbi:MAG: PaaI family thioesterase [Chloroflexi bacterium]|nr:PaaI family thioesterase [Chloroflexota bacterium]MBP8057339.1 PaaI family thioesterase [Chloroflexota bacterium]
MTTTQNMTNILQQLSQQAPQNGGLKLPPPVALLMEVEFVSYEEGQAMTNRFPVKEMYQNPVGHMQGGMIAAAIDNTLGPLSFLLAPYSTTTHLNLTYIRPVTPEMSHILVTARLVERTRSQLHLTATVTSEEGKTLAIAQATQRIL